MRGLRVTLVCVSALILLLAACSSKPEVEQPAAGGSAASGSSATSTVKTAALAAGTQIRVRTTSTLSTKSAKSGDSFTAVLDEPIRAGDWLIADRGAAVEGKVANSDPGGRVKGVASISVTLTSLTTADGQKIDLNTDDRSVQAKTTKKKDAAKIGIGAGAGAAIGAIAGGGKGAAIGAAAGGAAGTGVVLATHGDPAVIPAETALTFTLKTPVTITKK